MNITIFNFTDSYKKFNETKSNSSATVSYIISNFSSGASVLATKDSVAWIGLTGNSTGYVSFDYTGSSALFEIGSGVMPSTTASVSTEESSSGGGYPTYKPTSEQLEEGYEIGLRENWEISFDVSNESHELRVDDVGAKTATVTVSSEPVTFDLGVGETKRLDLDSDGFYDLEVFLKGVSGFSFWRKAGLVVRLIDKEIPSKEIVEGEEEQNFQGEGVVEEESNLWLWIVLGVVVVLVCFLIFRGKKKQLTPL